MRPPAPTRSGSARTATLLALVAAVAPVLATVGDASAQGLHPLPMGPRPLHLRLADADVVALGTVESIAAGRIGVKDAVALRGEPGERFEIKRAPSAPPPLAIGVRALFPLRGARSPYVLVDEPREVAVFQDDREAERWADAARALLDAAGQPERLRRLYVAWLDEAGGPLQQMAGAALLDARSRLTPFPPEAARARARAAADPDADAHRRRVSALLALGDPAGVELLLESTPGTGADPRVVELTLRAAAAAGAPGLTAALLRALAHPDPAIRRAGLGAAALAWSEPVAERLAEMGESDPDPRLRRDAARALARRAGIVEPPPGAAERRRRSAAAPDRARAGSEGDAGSGSANDGE